MEKTPTGIHMENSSKLLHEQTTIGANTHVRMCIHQCKHVHSYLQAAIYAIVFVALLTILSVTRRRIHSRKTQ